jgi:hypothetical protein
MTMQRESEPSKKKEGRNSRVNDCKTEQELEAEHENYRP